MVSIKTGEKLPLRDAVGFTACDNRGVPVYNTCGYTNK